MFETSKLPTEQRTVTGNPVSFNTHYALPLDACKVSFSATQAGSGYPSPSNPRAISGVSSIGLNANSTPVSVSFGETRYGGYVDVVGKKLVLTYGYGEYDGSVDENWEMLGASNNRFFRIKVAELNTITSEINQISNIYLLGHIASVNGTVGFRVYDSPNLDGAYLVVRPDNVANMVLSDFIQLLTNTPMQVVYEYVTPIEISLPDIPDLSSILGNNTFSTDTGTLEITFSDLQEKSASGAIATFNTALAMPLVNGEFSIMAYQEGSGDPSPTNVRNIVGYNELRVNMVNWNQLAGIKNAGGLTVSIDNDGIISLSGVSNTSYAGINTNVNVIKNEKYYKDFVVLENPNSVNFNWGFFNITMTNSQVNNTIMSAGSSGTSGTGILGFLAGTDFNGVKLKVVTINLTKLLGTKLADELYQMEQTETGTGVALFKQVFYKDYYAYNAGGTWVSVASVNGDSYPDYAEVNLGEDVYGGIYNSVTGKMLVTRNVVDLGTLTWGKNNTEYAFTYFTSYFAQINGGSSFLQCTNYKYVNVSRGQLQDLQIGKGNLNDSRNFCVRDDSKANLTTQEFKTAMSGVYVSYPLLNPFEVQLTPTQIETLIGNNTIFADTGDVDLTYKDCDLAKRGDFRQVFKIPD